MSVISKSNTCELDVIGIGNAIVDVLIQVDDSFLEAHSLKKGSMMLLDQLEAEKIFSSIEPDIQISGGSAANTLACIANLGGRSGFIGRVKNDELGAIFTEDIRKVGARFDTKPVNSGPPTARCMIFVTPDAQRTMCTYLGASVLIDPSTLDLSLIEKSKVLYLEGYLWDNEAAKRAFITASETCKLSNGKVALSLSDSFCVDRHRESFIDLVNNNIDILFSNESEIISLFKCSNLEAAIKEVTGCCEIAIITCGEKGSIILSESRALQINAYDLGPLIDTTGAGDLYAGGFLYGYTNNFDLRKCGEIGSICAAKIITQLGSRPSTSLKDLLLVTN